MVAIHTLDKDEKLKILADDSRYDLAGACGTKSAADHRRRGEDGLWVYPASVPRGGSSILLKTLQSNACSNDCRYCPLRRDRDVRRVAMTPRVIVAVRTITTKTINQVWA